MTPKGKNRHLIDPVTSQRITTQKMHICTKVANHLINKQSGCFFFLFFGLDSDKNGGFEKHYVLMCFETKVITDGVIMEHTDTNTGVVLRDKYITLLSAWR